MEIKDEISIKFVVHYKKETMTDAHFTNKTRFLLGGGSVNRKETP